MTPFEHELTRYLWLLWLKAQLKPKESEGNG